MRDNQAKMIPEGYLIILNREFGFLDYDYSEDSFYICYENMNGFWFPYYEWSAKGIIKKIPSRFYNFRKFIERNFG